MGGEKEVGWVERREWGGWRGGSRVDGEEEVG